MLRLRQVIFGGQDEELWAMEVLAVQRQGGVVRGEGGGETLSGTSVGDGVAV